MDVGEQALDLSDCDREPIHQLGAIQPIGFLLAFTAEWKIQYVSDNVAQFTGHQPDALIDRDLSDVLDRNALHQIRNRMFQVAQTDIVERLFGIALLATAPTQRFDCAVHMSNDMIVLEAEPSEAADPLEIAGMVKAMIGRVDAASNLPAFFRQGALQVQALTGFDRVMVYRFDRDESGEVVAEVARGGIESLLGLRYPATDIPQQARALYLRTPFRIIGNAGAAPVPIHAAPHLREVPLDLSLSILRAVSPIHIAYLRNMGVRASLSISIVVEGKLWGLFVCHHNAPRCPSFEMRTLAELFVQLFAMKLEARERRAAALSESEARAACDRLMAAIAQDVGLLRDAEAMVKIIGGIVACDGVAIRLNGRTARSGSTPSSAVLEKILERSNVLAGEEIFTTDHLAGLGLADPAGNDDVAGMLLIPISSLPRDYVMMFRNARLRHVTWAGEPNKPVVNERLTPRASFAAWSEDVRDRATPFSDAELVVAKTLRSSLIEVVLRMVDAAGVERQRSTERQEFLIAELNHRVRNILALISGLVTQSRNSDMSVEAYTALLDGRIQALARAHDQITRDNWGPARLRSLFEGECAVAMTTGRLGIIGAPILLEPGAFSTLALVIHELMTNSTKHGALSADGRVLVDWKCDADGNLTLAWREEGGPTVHTPKRNGLGKTIIERSIPYDLGGTADVVYAPTGIEALFTIPAVHVSSGGTEAAVPAPVEERAAVPAEAALLSGIVLLVEDSLIIAIHVCDMLVSLGAGDAIVAASVSEAFAELDRVRPTFAVLDINLGAETSMPVADRLLREGIPFVFATGYGKQFAIPEQHAHVPIVQKPYNRANLADALIQYATEAGPAKVG